MIKTKSLIISGSVIIGLSFLLMVYFSLFSLGIIQARVKELVIKTDSISVVYDGNAHRINQYQINKGVLQDGHEIKVYFTASQTEVGTAINHAEFSILDEDKNDVTAKYLLTLQYGIIRVSARPLKINTSSDLKVYDGNPLSNNGWKIIEGELAKDHEITATLSESITNAGQKPNKVHIKITDPRGTDVTKGYNISYDTGLLIIIPSPLKITSSSANKEYDGLPLINHEWVILEGRVYDGHDLDVEVLGEITEPGVVDNDLNVAIYDQSGIAVTANYQVILEPKQLEVYKKHIVLSSESDQKLYDGTPLANNNWTHNSGQLAAGDYLEASVTGSITNSGTADNLFTASVYNSGGINVSNFYDIEYIYGSLEVIKRNISISSESAVKTYDGTALTNSNWSQDGGVLVGEEYLEVLVRGSITNVGIADNLFTAIVYSGSGINVSSNYEIDYVYGSLEIIKADITLKSASDSKIYDGTPLTNANWTQEGGHLVAGDYVVIIATGSITNFGTASNFFTAIVYSSSEINVSSNYEIHYEYGTLEIMRVEITLSSASDSKIYDGTPLTNPNWAHESGNLIVGDRMEVLVSGSITNFGVTDNVFIINVYNTVGMNVSYNYHTTYEYGKLEIFKVEITLSSASDSKVYDGTPLTNSNWAHESGNLAVGDRLEVLVSGNITSFGVASNLFTVNIYNDAGINVSENYDVRSVYGLLEIIRIDITVSSGSANKIYDGTPLTNSNWTHDSGSLVIGDYLEVLVSGSITNAGQMNNWFMVTVYNSAGINVSDCYNISSNYGLLEIISTGIVISSASANKFYDGTPLSSDIWMHESGQLFGEDYLEVVVMGSITNAGIVDNWFLVTVYNGEGINVSNNYDIQHVNGLLEILRVNIVLSSGSANKVYDGTSLTNNIWIQESGDLIANDYLDVLVTGSITDPGTIDNLFSASVLNDFGIDVSNNYYIQYVNGLLEITRIEITVSSSSASKNYDGTPLINHSCTLSSGALMFGDHLDFLVTGSITTPGTTNNLFTAIVYNSLGIDVSNNYELNYEYGLLEIMRANITISSDSASKYYDGTPLINHSWTHESGLLIGDDRLDVLVTGSITNPGTTNNLFTASVYNIFGIDVSDNYQINYAYGTLEVLRTNIVIISDSSSKLYDGNPLINHDWTQESGELAIGDYLDVIVTSSITNPGTIQNLFTVNVYNSSGINISTYYNIELIYGSLEVVKRDIVISSASASKVYDGTPLTNHDWTRESGELAIGDYLDVIVTSSITNPGTIQNLFTASVYNILGIDVSDNYQINYAYGTLEVLRTNIVIISDSSSKLYDGTPLINHDWTQESGELAIGDYLDVIVTSSITNPGTIQNLFTVNVYNSSGINISTYYNIEFIYGSLEVVKRDIVISSASASKAYDGTPLTNHDWTRESGELAIGDYLEVIITGSITNCGIIQNLFTVNVYNSSGINISIYYNSERIYGSLEVFKQNISVRSGSASKVYDGTPLINHDWDRVSGEFATGDYLDAIVTSSITNPGNIQNLFTASVYNSDGINVSNNYEINYLYGELEIYKLSITVVSGSSTKEYNGVALTSNQWDLVDGSLLSGDYLVVVGYGSITLPGTSENIFNVQVYNSQDENVDHLYNINKISGLLKVNAINITITSASDFKVYDGTPLTAPEYEIVSGACAVGHILTVNVIGTITEVGTVNNVMHAYVTNQDSIDVSGYYIFNLMYGELTVLTGVYSSGDLSKDPFDFDEELMLEVLTNRSETVYLRDKSFGDYNQKGFVEATAYNFGLNTNPLSYSSVALMNNGFSPNSMDIKFHRDYIPYLSPCYRSDNINAYSDVNIYGPYSNEYNANYISYNFLQSSAVYIQNGAVSAQEAIYRNFVYANYLGLPATTRQALLQIAALNNLDINSPGLIADIQRYIQNAAEYEMAFPSIPQDADTVIYFLTVSKKGICQHFAASATLMYRALGIPARYVTGYVAHTVANQWTEVTNKKAHAWLEIYIDGMGWVPIEVTPGGAGGDIVSDLKVKPVDVLKLYDGLPITATSITGLEPLLLLGYTYEVEFSGSQMIPGESESSISSLIIYDENNNDVTDSFNIIYGTGKLRVYISVLNLRTGSYNREYNNEYLVNMDANNYELTGALQPGHTLFNVNFTGQQLNVGSSANRARITIIDEFGHDVTSIYAVTTNFGSLVVTPKTITIKTASASKHFDGQELTSSNYEVIGEVAIGDELVVVIDGSQTSIGSSDNTVDSVGITRNGIDVSQNYSIEIEYGKLVVLQPL